MFVRSGFAYDSQNINDIYFYHYLRGGKILGLFRKIMKDNSLHIGPPSLISDIISNILASKK